jgi:hypothetical protein
MAAAIEQELSFLRSYEQKISAIDSSQLTARNYADQRMILSNIRSDMFRIEDQKVYTQNPMTYAGAVDLNIYIKRNFAPIENRIKSIIAIEEKVPSIFEAARANLEDSWRSHLCNWRLRLRKDQPFSCKGYAEGFERREE